jgi:hypothetical protein
MELAWTESVGLARVSQSSENAIIARCEFEGFEDVVLDTLDQAAQPRQANEGSQARELELRIFSLPAARKFVDPVQRNSPITRPARREGLGCGDQGTRVYSFRASELLDRTELSARIGAWPRWSAVRNRKIDLREPVPRAPDNSDLEFVGKILE